MLAAFTLALDAEPWIEHHLPVFQQLSVDWQWIVVHGASMNGGSTNWCQPQKPRLSADGTTEYLRAINDKRVIVIERKSWSSKDAMCNAAVEQIDKRVGDEGCVLMQIDSDELWRAEQLEKIANLFSENSAFRTPQSALFSCRYFVGPNLITQGENCFGDYPYEWLRAWRYHPGQRFISHELPVLEGDNPERRLPKTATRAQGLVFDHMAYATEAQVRYKQDFYGYAGAVNQWLKLQEYDRLPVELSRFFSWVPSDDKATIIKR